MLESENWRIQDLEAVADCFKDTMTNLLQFILDLKRMDKTFAIVSTPAKGNTLLNYAHIGRYIDFATDRSKLKQGRFLPGTGIEVFSDEELIKRQPDYAIVLAWNFFDEIITNVRNAGFKGKFIRPLPKIEII